MDPYTLYSTVLHRFLSSCLHMFQSWCSYHNVPIAGFHFIYSQYSYSTLPAQHSSSCLHLFKSGYPYHNVPIAGFHFIYSQYPYSTVPAQHPVILPPSVPVLVPVPAVVAPARKSRHTMNVNLCTYNTISRSNKTSSPRNDRLLSGEQADDVGTY